MDGERGQDWGSYSSICLPASMGEAEQRRDGFKSTECKKHLRVKSQNVENAENHKHTKRQNKVKLKIWPPCCYGSERCSDYIFMIVICIMHWFSVVAHST